MSEREKIQHKVGRLRLTRRWQTLLDYAVAGLFWGGTAAALLVLISKLMIIPWLGSTNLNLWLVAGTLMALGLLGYVVASLFVRITPLAVANDIDVSLGLRERVSSALALGEGKSAEDPFVKTLVKDAADTVEDLPLRKVYPWGLPPAWKLALPVLLLAVGLTFMPQFNLFASDEDREEVKLIQEQGKELLKLAEKREELAEKEQVPQVKEQLKDEAQEIKRVGQKLEDGKIKKKEALKELQRLKEKLENQALQNIPEGQKQLVAELAEELKKLTNTRELGELLESGDMQAFAKQLEQLQQNLAQGKMTPSDRKFMEDLAAALDEALKSSEADNPEAQALKESLEKLQGAIAAQQKLQQDLNETMQAFQQDLNNLTKELSAAGMDQQAQQLQQQAQQMQQELAQDGALSQQSMQAMQSALQQAQQAAENNQQLSPSQQQQLSQSIQQCESYFESPDGQPGQMSQQNSQAQQMNQMMGQMMNQAQKDCTGGT